MEEDEVFSFDQPLEAEDRRPGDGPRHHPDSNQAEGGARRAPFSTEDVRGVKERKPEASERRLCRALRVPRASLRRDGRPAATPAAKLNEDLVREVRSVIEEHPTFGYPRIWAIPDGRNPARKSLPQMWSDSYGPTHEDHFYFAESLTAFSTCRLGTSWCLCRFRRRAR